MSHTHHGPHAHGPDERRTFSGRPDLNPGEPHAFTRRQFAKSALALASASAFAPSFLQRTAFGLPAAAPGARSIPGVDEGRVLVVVQLSGGNDGLNTVAPYGLDEYRRARPRIGLSAEDTLPIERRFDGLGLHRALEPVKGLYDEGLCAIVQGVGYPNPNRSHFRSMDIWHTADLGGRGDGWLGRYFDSECPNGACGTQPGLAIGRTAPLAMEGQKVKPVSFESAELFRWSAEGRDENIDLASRAMLEESASRAFGDSNTDFLARTGLDARVSSQVVRDAVSKRPLVDYPGTPLAQQLSLIGSMIRAGLDTRVYYAVHGGFDTHAQQGGGQGTHARLQTQYAEAVAAFYKDHQAQANDSRVLTMTFSEFGRRVGQNASGGTDHGTAAPMFLFGPMVKPGLHGTHPSLTQLDEGDLVHTTDFRGVYAQVLKQWLGADPRQILGRSYAAPRVLNV